MQNPVIAVDSRVRLSHRGPWAATAITFAARAQHVLTRATYEGRCSRDRGEPPAVAAEEAHADAGIAPTLVLVSAYRSSSNSSSRAG
jgi:hypothetical protein